MNENKQYWLMFIVAVFASFYLTLGVIPLFDLDEGAFSEATREMLKNGDYITTYLNGQLRFDKPILIYWLQAMSVSAFGLNEFALRLPSALAATGWAASIYVFARKHFELKTAFLAAIFMVFSVQVSIVGKAAIADALLNLWIAVSMLSMYQYISTRNKTCLMLAFAAIALGTLTKGPVAILVPLASSFLYALVKKELKFWLHSVFNPYGLLLFLVIAAPWYVLEYLDQGQKFIDGFFLKHNISRFEGAMEGHTGSFLYYLPVLILGLLPFTGIFIRAIGLAREWLKDDLKLYLLIWFLFVLVFFSFSSTKLPHYIIYGYTPLFILMGVAASEVRRPWLILLWPLLALVFLYFVPDILVQNGDSIRDAYSRSLLPVVPEAFGTAYRWIMAISAGLLLLLMFTRLKPVYQYPLSGLIVIIAVNAGLMPAVAELQQVPVKQAARFAARHDLKVNMYKLNTPTFNVYSRSLVSKTKPVSGDVVLTKKIYLDRFNNPQILFQKNGIVLFKVTD